jgi:hypothetical protein
LIWPEAVSLIVCHQHAGLKARRAVRLDDGRGDNNDAASGNRRVQCDRSTKRRTLIEDTRRMTNFEKSPNAIVVLPGAMLGMLWLVEYR